eukprot:scaffold32918_cov174-Isochrysis_galbana.AAC.1
MDGDELEAAALRRCLPVRVALIGFLSYKSYAGKCSVSRTVKELAVARTTAAQCRHSSGAGSQAQAPR